MNALHLLRPVPLAAGLGVALAVAAGPGRASADADDWWSAMENYLSSASSAGTATSDFQISFDGVDLLPTAGNTATAVSGLGDYAVAIGDGSKAIATGGSDDYAYASGTDATAIAGGTAGSHNDVAGVDGDYSTSVAGGYQNVDGTVVNPGASDYALIFGNNDVASAGSDTASAGSYDVAYSEGDSLAKDLASGADYLLNIVKFYGDGATSSAAESASVAADSGNLLGGADGLTELLSLFGLS